LLTVLGMCLCLLLLRLEKVHRQTSHQGQQRQQWAPLSQDHQQQQQQQKACNMSSRRRTCQAPSTQEQNLGFSNLRYKALPSQPKQTQQQQQQQQ
jgi:hypothetical protein